MDLTALDIIVLLLVGGSAVLGLSRGFVAEVLSLVAWIAVVFAVKFLHTPVANLLLGFVGTSAGAAVLAFALLVGGTWIGGRAIANAVGRRTRTGVLGPVDRALGFGFGALKGLIGASLLFLLIVLVLDTIRGGPTFRPSWITTSRTYPLLDATGASISDFVDRRRRGESVTDEGAAPGTDAVGE